MARRLPKGPKISKETMEYLDPSEVSRGLERRAATERPLGLLVAEARRRGYAPGTKVEHFIGFRRAFRAAEDIQPPKGSTEAPIRELSIELSAQSFISTKKGSRDHAGIVVVTLQAGSNSKRDEMFIEVPGGNFAQAREFVVRNDAVVRARSWTTRYVKCMYDVGCYTAVKECMEEFGLSAKFVQCILEYMYACYIMDPICKLCASCNCAWWCRWAVGCCK